MTILDSLHLKEDKWVSGTSAMVICSFWKQGLSLALLFSD